MKYKVVEIQPVTDDLIERTLNEWTAKGWSYDDLRFVMKEGSRRPALAFVFFTKVERQSEEP